MTNDEKFDLIIKKLTSLEDGQKILKESQKGLEEGQKSLREELLEFKNQTEENFENTNKLIDQAFEKINENISFQDKVTQIEKIIHSRGKSLV